MRSGGGRAAKVLTPEQFDAVAGLVGADLAREDESAVAVAFGDFRVGMDELRETFGTITNGEAGGERG